MPSLPFVDTNIFVRHLVGDHLDHSPRATAFLMQVQEGEFTVRTANTVIFETVFVSEKVYRLPRQSIYDALVSLLALDTIILPERPQILAAFDLYLAHAALSFADCYHAVLMKHLELTEIVTFDRGFDRLPGITRIEP
jgi:predicted nucleic acid-binding protein